jgi:hypothetical protein
MHRRLAVLTALVALAATAVVATAPPVAGGGPCQGQGQVQVRGQVTDALTRRPLTEITSVGVNEVGGPADGVNTNPASRWSTCLDPGTYTFNFFADSYRLEWFHNRYNAANATPVVVAAPGPVIVHESLLPNGRWLTGRVTNMRGAPRSASVGIWRLTARGWRSIDGEGNDSRTGIWAYRVPAYGRYRVNASVDYHWSRWHRRATRLRFARTVVVGPRTRVVRNVDVRVPYCHPVPDFCIPRGFGT